MEIQDIQPKQDDAQRLLALNGVPKVFWLSAEEINLILDVLARLLGNESNLYKGEHQDLQYLNAAHPLPEPGSYAQIIVVDGDNLKASWDNTDKKWFLDGLYVEPGSDAAYLLKSVHDVDGDGIIDKAKDLHEVLTAGGTKYYGTKNGVVGVFDFPAGSEGGTSSPTEIVSLDPNWQGGLNFEPVATFKEQGVLKNDSRPLTADPADPNFDRFDVLGIDLTVDQLKIIKGAAQDPPIEPSYDPLTFLPGKFILIKAGAAIPDGFVGVTVYNEGNEWQNTNAGPDFDRLNQESPAVGLYAIKVVSPLGNSQALPFVAPVPKSFEEGMKISYKFKNIVGGIHRWLVGGTKTNGRPGSIWIDAPFNYSASSLVYQALSVTIPSGILTSIDKISLVSGTEGLRYFVDDVKLVTGTEAVSGGGVTLEQMNSALALKVDKVTGYGLSQENFSPAEKTKLANVIELHKGTYTTITALRTAFPEGPGQSWHQNRGGWTGDVDAGTSANVVRYLWDASDLKWVLQQGETTAETAESVKTKLLQNPDTFIVNQAEKDAIAAAVDKRLSTLVSDLSPEEKTSIKNKLGIGDSGPGGIGNIDFGLTGAVNGTNKIFQTSAVFTPGKVLVFLNGIAQTLGADYTESTTQIIEFIEAPHVNDKIIAIY